MFAAKYWTMGCYSEENCHAEALEPPLDWASGRKAPVLQQSNIFTNSIYKDIHQQVNKGRIAYSWTLKFPKAVGSIPAGIHFTLLLLMCLWLVPDGIEKCDTCCLKVIEFWFKYNLAWPQYYGQYIWCPWDARFNHWVIRDLCTHIHPLGRLHCA